ncbi:MAG TPA: metallopeptidase family protein [Vicinamibacterales bacterium]|nr:metallopeptidase family protein [Vicinamibacterales bacterium]
MTREIFTALVQEAIDTIPAEFARAIHNVAIIVEDRPSPELLAEMAMEDDESLLGLYQGIPLTQRQSGYGNALPDRISLYQLEIEEDCDGDEDEIVGAIGETLIHELGHYFGMDEDQIMEIEERYWRGDASAPDPKP